MAGPPLRVVLCTSGGLAGSLVLDRLLRAERFTVAAIVLSSRILRPGQGLVSGAREYVRRCGLAYAAYVACSSMLSDRALAQASVAGRARREAIALLETDRINAPESLAFLAKAKPDLLVSAFFNQRIGPGALAAAPLGGLNIHPGALPRFRGVDPVFRAWLEEAPTLEASVHRVSAEFDAGALLGNVEVAAVAGESLLRATARTYAAGAARLVGLADAIAERVPGRAQDEGAARYDSWPTREEVARLRGRGVALARWSDLSQATRIVESARTSPP
ncbi:hypothetical protein BWI17_14780 [Betaproteobacteria bacterium GR16-43]|nr:hypothetical protein BWI17_14780 [Betaproteobacteria bacterium GR16-43]